MRHLIFTSILLVASVNAEASCRDGRWTPVEGSTMMALRSNSCHFWSWAADQASRLLPKAMLEGEVLVTGDAHHENFSHMPVGRKRVYVPNDLDDTGQAPAILDFLKFMAVSRSVQAKDGDLSSEFMVQSYLDGLNGKRYSGTFPKWLEKDRDVTAGQFAQDVHKEADHREKDGKFKEDDGLKLWADLSSAEKREFQRLEEDLFKRSLPRGWEILDRAIKTKGDRGGSVGLSRFWFLMRDDNGKKQILEFKELRKPAVWLYQSQGGSDRTRMMNSLKAYWGSELPATFKVLQADSRLFWMRPKLPNYVNFKTSDFREETEKFADLTGFISYNLGKWHGEQLGERRVQRLGWETRAVKEAADKFVEAYLHDVKKERRE